MEHTDTHCPACAMDLADLIELKRFAFGALRFVSIATPIILATATFIVLVTR